MESAVPSFTFYGVEHMSMVMTVHNSANKCVSQRGGYAVSHLVEALRDKMEGQMFGSMLGHWDFSLTKSFQEV